MPYQSIMDLPPALKEHLPIHAQEIYLNAFNNAWEHYKEPEKRRLTSSREETAHKVAWAAVKKKYVKKQTHWIERENSA